MGLMSMFPGGGGTNNQPLKAPTNFLVAANTQTSVAITWTDPENEYSQPSGALIGEWMFTRIIRKVGSAPVNANDGVVIVESAVKNQYQSTPYIDSGLVQGTLYYYGAFAYTKTRVQSPGVIFEYDLKGYDSILQNNTWNTILLACTEGVASDIWSVGDTKTETIGEYLCTFQISAFNPSFINLTDGSGHPAILFTTKYSPRLSTWGDSSVDGYDEGGCVLRSTIDSFYNNAPNDLKNGMKQCAVSTYGVTTNTEYVDGQPQITRTETVRTHNVYTFPVGTDRMINNIFPTASSRIIKSVNEDGEAVSWWTGDVRLHSVGGGGGAWETGGYNYYSETGSLSYEGGTSSLHSVEHGTVFGFGFGKVGG